MTKVADLPPLKIFPYEQTEPWLYNVHWRETHARTANQFARVGIWLLHGIAFIGAFAFSLWLGYVTNFYGHPGPAGPLLVTLQLAVPLMVVWGLWFVITEAFVFADWRGSIDDSIDGYPGWYCGQAHGFAALRRNSKDRLEVNFARFNKRIRFGSVGKEYGSNVLTSPEDIQGFSLMMEADYVGANHMGSQAPQHNLIVVDLGPRGAFPVCQHFGLKADAATLQAKLVQAFITNRPKAAAAHMPATDDDPI